MPRPVSEILERLYQTPIVRTFAVDRKTVDQSARTVQLAFASDKPIEDWFGLLSLTMSKKAMRSERLKSGAPLLMDHDPRDVVGVIENHSIGTDGLARATVRFGESPRAQEIFRDVQTGIRPNVSVGLACHALQFEGEVNGIPTYRSDDWEPLEISIVSIPADISVGVGRSIQKVRNNMPEEFEGNNQHQLTGNVAIATEIRAWGKAFQCEDLATSYLRRSVDDNGNFTGTKEQFLATVRAAQPPTVKGPQISAVDQAARSGGPVELAHSVPRHSVRNFTGEGAQERAYRFGQWVAGTLLGNQQAREWCNNRGMLNRAMSEGSNERGGYLVPEEFASDLIVLVEQHGVYRRNANVVTMNSDSYSTPRLTADLAATFVGESQSGTNDEMEYDRLSLVAKKIMILAPFSSELSDDSTISIGDQLAGSAGRAFALKEDQCGFNGDGTSTYGGMQGICTKLKDVDTVIANIAGLQVGTGNAYSELTLADFEGVVARLPVYADMHAKWFVSKRFYWNVMVKLLLAAGSGVTATEIEDARNQKFLGYPVEYVQTMPTTEANSQVCALLGDLAMGALFGDRRSIRISLSDQPLFEQDDWLFKATERFDVNVHGVGDTNAAGPIVGLITAAS
jgi:HK97 family phage major capsid protein